MRDTAIIINELGDAGLDHILANSNLAKNVDSHQIKDNTVLLNSGCLCCSLKSELADTMRDLYFKRSSKAIPEFKRLIIETTGMADPGRILANIMNEPVIESTYRLDGVIVTVDSIYGLKEIDASPEARKQVAVADVLVITKTDLASESQIRVLSEKIGGINPGATQHKIMHGNLAPSFIIDIGLFKPLSNQPDPKRWLREPANGRVPKATIPKKIHHDEISSFTIMMPKPLNWSELKNIIFWLCKNHGENLLRLKGIIHAEDQPFPLAVHAVHFTPYPPILLDGWNEEEPLSRIVVIGKGLDEIAIREAFRQL
jgi:G3E family GTPase